MPSTVYGTAHKVVKLPAGGCSSWQQRKFDTVIYITKTHVKALDKPNQHCDAENAKLNTSACIAGFIEQKVGCNAMTLGSQYSKAPPCSTKLQLQALANISKTLEQSDENDLYNMTGCLPSCERDRYSLSADPLKMDTAFSYLGEVNCQLHLECRILDSSYKVEEQFRLYELDSFIADVGGFMGLLLGISLLSIYKAVEHCIKKLIRSFCIKDIRGRRGSFSSSFRSHVNDK